MAFTNPDVEAFKAQFFRDFPYAADDDDNLSKVQDQDIENAQAMADININEDLFGTQAQFSLAFNLLSAHYLASSLLASSQGVGSQYSWLTASKGAGSVSQSFSIPQKILDNPYLAMLSKTRYGALYLEIIAPLLVGNIFTVCGGTSP